MAHRQHYTVAEAESIAMALGIEFESVPFTVREFRQGLEMETCHGACDPQTDVTHDDPVLTGKLVLAHLNEYPDFYTRLAKMEHEAEEYWSKRRVGS